MSELFSARLDLLLFKHLKPFCEHNSGNWGLFVSVIELIAQHIQPLSWYSENHCKEKDGKWLSVCVSAFPFFYVFVWVYVCSVSTGNEMTGLVVSVETRERTPWFNLKAPPHHRQMEERAAVGGFFQQFSGSTDTQVIGLGLMLVG